MKKIISSICLGAMLLTVFTGCQNKTEDLNALYETAVRDAAFADGDEILPPVSLTESDSMTTWRDDKVLLLTWHNYPDSYPVGEDVTIEWGYVWTFTGKEIASYKKVRGS